MRITTCLTSAMVPLELSGSALDAAELPAEAARGPPPQPAVPAAAAPSPVYCRNRRRLRPGANLGPGCGCGVTCPPGRAGPLVPGTYGRGHAGLRVQDGPGRTPRPGHARR